MRRRIIPITTLILLAAAFQFFSAWGGGWAVVTLSELPDQVTAGEPVTIRFAVRQHGQRLAGGLETGVTAYDKNTGETLRAAGEPDGAEGYYRATLEFPRQGVWTWSIQAFGADHPMPDLTVQPALPPTSGLAIAAVPQAALLAASALMALLAGVLLLARRPRPWAAALLVLALAAGGYGIVSGNLRPATAVSAAEPAAEESNVERGEALFIAKGCTTCHANRRVTQIVRHGDYGIGPDLTHFSSHPDYLRLWLADPAAVRPNTLMPNLELSEAEIEALVAFLNSPAPEAKKPAQ